MGQVFKAVQPRLGRVVAVKMIHENSSTATKAIDRFRREVEAVSQLDHPNIARVLDAGDDGRSAVSGDGFHRGVNLSSAC